MPNTAKVIYAWGRLKYRGGNNSHIDTFVKSFFDFFYHVYYYREHKRTIKTVFDNNKKYSTSQGRSTNAKLFNIILMQKNLYKSTVLQNRYILHETNLLEETKIRRNTTSISTDMWKVLIIRTKYRRSFQRNFGKPN